MNSDLYFSEPHGFLLERVGGRSVAISIGLSINNGCDGSMAEHTLPVKIPTLGEEVKSIPG